MSALLVSAIVAAVAIYLTIGGAAGYATRLQLMSRCKSCRDGWCIDGHQIAWPTVVGALWPLAAPVFVGVGTAHRLTTREARADRREKRKQADHERKMAELEATREMTMESVRFLVENGIQAEVPGLFDAKGGDA